MKLLKSDKEEPTFLELVFLFVASGLFVFILTAALVFCTT